MISSQPKLLKHIRERNPTQELLDHSNFATYNSSSAIELWTTKNTKMNQAITDWENDIEICVEQLMMEDGEATSWVERKRKRLNWWRQMVASRLSQVVDCTTTCPGYITAAGRNEDGRYDCEDGRNDKRREKQRWVVSTLGFLVYINWY
jgi:hypothetical protein